MKTKIITLVFLLLSFSLFAQVKPDTAKKIPAVPHPGYVFDGSKPVNINVTLKAGLLFDYLYIIQNGGMQAITHSKTLTADQASSLGASQQMVMDSVNTILLRSYLLHNKAEQDRFTSDTLKLYHHK